MKIITEIKPFDEIVINGKTVEIQQDEDPESPREWDNLGTILYSSDRYMLGDKRVDADEIKQIASRNDVIALPVYAYIHSGVTVNTTGFECPWDSGQCGIIYVDFETIRKEFGCKYITKTVRTKIMSILRGEIETFDQYLRGDVYGYVVLDENGFTTGESCWGFYGEEAAKEAAREEIGE